MIEDQTTTGNFTLSAPDGLDPTAALTLAGTPISKAALEASGTTPISIPTPEGILTVTGYNPATGQVSYSYDPNGTAKDHSAGEVTDTISILVKDDNGDTQSGNLVINILDTAPIANADTNAITEDASSDKVGGNVMTTGAGTDTLGADVTKVTGIAAGTPASASGALNTAVSGTYGSLTMDEDGSYTYTLRNADPAVQALNAGQSVTDTFTYTITDADGDPSSTTLTITVNGTNDAPVISIGVGDSAAKNLTEGNSGLTTNGTLSLFDVDTTDTVTATKVNVVTVGGTYAGPRPTDAELITMFSASGSEPSTTEQSNPHGIAWGFNSGTQAFDFLPAGETVTLTYVVRATDANGASVDQPVTITITGTNDAPIATPDTASVSEDAADQIGYNDGTATTTIVGGNVLANDTDLDFGDTRTVTGVAFGTLPSASGNVASAVAGTYGSVKIAADGSYTYHLDNTKPNVQALAKNQSVTETFTYTITDSQGAASSTTLTVTVKGMNDAPDITVGSGDSDAANLTETNSGLSATGTLSIFDVDTLDTVSSSVTTVATGGTYAGLSSLPLTSAQLLAMFSVSGGEGSTTLQSNPNGIHWNFNSGSQAFNFIPEGQTLTLTYTVRATDSNGATDNQPVTVTITGTNDSGVLVNDTKTIAENASQPDRIGNVLSNDTPDPDYNEGIKVTGFSFDANGDGTLENYLPGDTVTVTTASGTLGIFTMNDAGAYSFAPHESNYSGAVPVITYTAGNATFSASATLTLTVSPVSDAPGVTRDAQSVTTAEDTAVALGFNAPTVSDAVDQNGAAAGDNPERLSLISLSGITVGAQILDAGNNVLYTATNSNPIKILLSDATNLIASPGTPTLTMTTAQFEALKYLPAADSGTNRSITMSVTEYEVNDSGVPLVGIAGVATSLAVGVNVLAVTDLVDLKINGSDTSHEVTINEDSALDLKALLSASFNDLDGSEGRSIIISNAVGNGNIIVNGTTVAAGGSITIAASLLSTSVNGFPAISIKAAPNFSGDLNDISVTLSAKDTDSDSTVTTLTQTDSVKLNLHVIPVAGDVNVPNVSMPEDTAVKFLQNVGLSDTDGSEALSGIVVSALPAGWVVRDESGVVVFTGNGVASYTIPTLAISSGSYHDYTVTPPSHSSADATISLALTTTDTNTVNGVVVTDTQTVTRSQVISVSAVAETVGTDSNADGTPDLTMNGSFSYSSAGKEDQWFNLNQNGFNFKAPWSNQDADEKTFALLTPVLGGGVSAIGSQFMYIDAGGATVTLTYNGIPLQIPMGSLDSVQFKAPPNVAGSFEINVQAMTIDTDPNTGATVTATSGSATLSNIVIEPVADPVTLAVNAPAVGLEDTAIPLVIRPTSADPSEIFTITIKGIPVGAVLEYGGTPLIVAVDGSVTIVNFDSATLLTLTPPLNSNVDIPLIVSAVSVDTSGGVTDMSDAKVLNLLVDVRGVADPVDLVIQSPMHTTEATVDGGNQRISLADVVTSVTPRDSDGSESVTLVISGVPAGFTLEGLSFMGGVDSTRIWSGSAAEIVNAKLVVLDANYSGTIGFNIRAVSTENDGNSLSGADVPVTIQVAPSPEATVTASTNVLEDTLTKLDFAIQFQNGDTNETLNSLWINAADLSGKPFALFLGATPLSVALAQDNGWYKLTAAQADNVFVKGAANSDADGSFAIKYEIRDPSNDGSVPDQVTQFDGSHTLNVSAVTDATVSTNNYAGGVISNTTIVEINVTVTQQDDLNAGGAKDIDGSESLLYFIIDGVPQGVTVEGGHYIGNTQGSSNTGRWILETPDVAFNGVASLNQTVRFALDGTSAQLSGLNQQISITAHTQDVGDVVRTSTTNWTLTTANNFVDTDPGATQPAATISQWEHDPAAVSMTEDSPTSLAALLDAQIVGSSPFAITITGLPNGSVVTGMLLTVLGGQNVWTVQGSGDNASLQGVLSSISIAPPPNWNDNKGSFGFNTTLTTYDDAGTRHDSSLTLAPSVTPVSDPIVLTSTDTNVAEDQVASINLSLANPADGMDSQVLDGKVYVRLDETDMESAGGVLSYNGSVVASTAVSGIAGIPDGSYYVLDGVVSTASLALAYQPVSNASGIVSYTAYVQGQEVNAANVTTSSVTGSLVISPMNDGVLITAPAVSGLEDQRVPFSIAANLSDSSESIVSVTLTHVPDGFLVFFGAGSGTMATNLGDGVWGIPLVAGAIPTDLSLQPPINWSGTVADIQVGIWSGEQGVDPVLTTSNLNVTVNGVADGISITPTLSFGTEGQVVALNLNSSMPDGDGSELATITIKGLGAFAAFHDGDGLLSATYNTGTDTYTISHLTNTQVTNLGMVQKDGSYDLLITAQTTDSPGGDTSALVSGTMHVDISAVVPTSGNDNLLFDGASLNGLGGVDTIQFRLGENLGAADYSKLDNIERLDLMPVGQNHSLTDLRIQDVLDMTDSGKSLTILGDAGDSVSLKNGAGADWTLSGTTTDSGHSYNIYVNALDPDVSVKIDQLVHQNINP